MHLTLKKEATKPASFNFLQQQHHQLRADLHREEKINLSRAFAGQLVGIREVADEIWLVSFMEYDLGFFDQDEGHVKPAPNPSVRKVLPMSPV